MHSPFPARVRTSVSVPARPMHSNIARLPSSPAVCQSWGVHTSPQLAQRNRQDFPLGPKRRRPSSSHSWWLYVVCFESIKVPPLLSRSSVTDDHLPVRASRQPAAQHLGGLVGQQRGIAVEPFVIGFVQVEGHDRQRWLVHVTD